MPTSNDRKMLSSNEALKELRLRLGEHQYMEHILLIKTANLTFT